MAEEQKISQILKSKRESRKLPLNVVHQQTRISAAYLEAIESGQWSVFPAEVYLVGSLKKYAAFLGLNPDETVALYRREQESVLQKQQAEEKKEEEPKAPEPEPEEEASIALKVVILVALVAVIGGWLAYTILRQPHAELKKSEPPLEFKNKFARSSFVQTEGLKLEVQALESVWVRIVPDQALAFEGFLAAGATHQYEAKNEILVRLGNANSVRLTLNGRTLNARRGAKKDVNDLNLTHASLLDETLFLGTSTVESQGRALQRAPTHYRPAASEEPARSTDTAGARPKPAAAQTEPE